MMLLNDKDLGDCDYEKIIIILNDNKVDSVEMVTYWISNLLSITQLDTECFVVGAVK